MNNEPYIREIGTRPGLYFAFSLFEYDYLPIVFVCISDIGDKYLCVCTEFRTLQRWVISLVETETIIALIQKRITTYNAIKENQETKYIVDYTFDEKYHQIECRFEDINPLDLPDENAYILECEHDALRRLLAIDWSLQMPAISNGDHAVIGEVKAPTFIQFSVEKSAVESKFDSTVKTDTTFKEAKDGCRTDSAWDKHPSNILDPELEPMAA